MIVVYSHMPNVYLMLVLSFFHSLYKSNIIEGDLTASTESLICLSAMQDVQKSFSAEFTFTTNCFLLFIVWHHRLLNWTNRSWYCSLRIVNCTYLDDTFNHRTQGARQKPCKCQAKTVSYTAIQVKWLLALIILYLVQWRKYRSLHLHNWGGLQPLLNSKTVNLK